MARKKSSVDEEHAYVPYFWRAQDQIPDVYDYSNLPTRLRHQIYALIEDAFRAPRSDDWYDDDYPGTAFEDIHGRLRREIGYSRNGVSDRNSLRHLFLEEPHLAEVLTGIELAFQKIESWGGGRSAPLTKKRAAEYVQELNARFDQHAIGFQYEHGQIFERQSEFLHAEVTRPALKLLTAARFAGAMDEFLKAHQFYRDQEYKSSMGECGKAFESTLKVICRDRGWQVPRPGNASNLIDTILKNELIPDFLQNNLSGIKNTLTSGVPTIRNQRASHGQGPAPIIVPRSLASYQLHLTASVITYLALADEEKP